MKLDYGKPFKEGTGYCKCAKSNQTSGNDPAIQSDFPSREFTVHITIQQGRKPDDFIYWHYVCKNCLLPSNFYIQFCWWCQLDFYGIPKADKCISCQKEHPE